MARIQTDQPLRNKSGKIQKPAQGNHSAKRPLAQRTNSHSHIKHPELEMAELRRLLRRYRDSNSLVCYTDIARNAALPWGEDDDYFPICDVFCDGIEIKLGQTPVDEVRRLKSELHNRICGVVPEISLSFMCFNERNSATFAWLTLNSNCHVIDGRFIDKMAKVAQTVQEFAAQTWDLSTEQ